MPIGKHMCTSKPRGNRGLTINLTLRFLGLWVEPGVPREKQHKRRKNMHKEKFAKPGIRSANHCTLCQFYYYSFFFFLFYSLRQLCLTGPHSWGSPHQKPLTGATLFYCCSWTIESFWIIKETWREENVFLYFFLFEVPQSMPEDMLLSDRLYG